MTQKTHSPFHVVENFLSPGQCELIRDEYGVDPCPEAQTTSLKGNTPLVELIRGCVMDQVEAIQARYNVRVVSMETPSVYQYFEDASKPAEAPRCENSRYLRKKWVRTKDVDLVGYIWLKDYCNKVPLDPRHEVYGGKLEFPAYNFSLVPQQGTMVMFPAGPHFITAVSPIMVGSLEQIRFSMKVTVVENDGLWLYQPKDFPGDFTNWFE